MPRKPRLDAPGLTFVEQVLAVASHEPAMPPRPDPDAILGQVAAAHGIAKSEILGNSRGHLLSSARAEYAHRLSKEVGASASSIAREISVSRSAAWRMIKRGEISETT